MKVLTILFGVLALFVCFVIYNVEHEVHAAVATAPAPGADGKLKLHSQLEQVKQSEAQTEKQAWNSIAKLHGLIRLHQHRIEELTGNSSASEILAYDHESVTRLEKRIAAVVEEQTIAEEKAEAAAQ